MRIVDPTVDRPRDRNYKMCKFENTYTQDNRQLRDEKSLLYNLYYIDRFYIRSITLRPRIICRSIFWQCNMQFQTEVNEISLVVSPHSY